MKHFGEDWDENDFPIAYLITFRTFGTWLHGDKRGSIDVHRGQNKYNAPKIKPNLKLEAKMAQNLNHPEVILDSKMRSIVESAIKEVCRYRGYKLLAINVRTNHAHVVVSGQCKPEPIADAFKSYSTRKLREEGLIDSKTRPWARGRSRRYLWKEQNVDAAINYVLYEQGDVGFEMGD